MDFFNDRYYKVTSTLLSVVGLWPYQSTLRRFYSSIIFVTLILSVVLPELIELIQHGSKNFETRMENTMLILFSLNVIVSYIILQKNSEQLKLLLSKISNDWQELKTKEELQILRAFNENGRFMAIFLTAYGFFAGAVFSFSTFAPYFLDRLFPLENKTRDLIRHASCNYVFFEQSDYHYETLIYMTFVGSLQVCSMAGTGSIYVIIVKHTCGMFAIICYRLENIVKSIREKRLSVNQQEVCIQSSLKEIITLHYQILQYCKLLNTSFSLNYFVAAVSSVLGIALGSLYLSFVLRNVMLVVRFVGVGLGSILYIFYINLAGQEIIDASENVFYAAYFSNWYLTSAKGCKTIEIILIRSFRPIKLTAGKLFTISRQTFGELVKATFSYLSVFLAMTS